MRARRPIQSTLRSVDPVIHRHVLYPAKRWLTLYHFTGLIMLLTALSLITQPAPSVLKLDALTKAPVTLILAFLFTVFGTVLLVRPLSGAGYKTCLLPIYLYASISIWYAVTGQAGTYQGVITQLTIIGFLWIASTDLPKEGGDDSYRRD